MRTFAVDSWRARWLASQLTPGERCRFQVVKCKLLVQQKLRSLTCIR